MKPLPGVNFAVSSKLVELKEIFQCHVVSDGNSIGAVAGFDDIAPVLVTGRCFAGRTGQLKDLTDMEIRAFQVV